MIERRKIIFYKVRSRYQRIHVGVYLSARDKMRSSYTNLWG